jgi:hypothetical protein
MKQLDDIIEKLDSLSFPIYVKGKEYPANNPYILNEISAMLKAGEMKKKNGSLTEPIETLEPSDLKWDNNRLSWSEDQKYLTFKELEKVYSDIGDQIIRLIDENYAIIHLQK